jgi:hypothetical protein
LPEKTARRTAQNENLKIEWVKGVGVPFDLYFRPWLLTRAQTSPKMPQICGFPFGETATPWAKISTLEPSTYSITQLTDHSVSCIVKERVRLLARVRGKTVEEAAELIVRFSGRRCAGLPHQAAHTPQVGCHGQPLYP